MPIVSPCSAPGCSTLTIGEYCLAHEHPPEAAQRPGRGVALAALAAALAGLVAAFLARARLSL